MGDASFGIEYTHIISTVSPFGTGDKKPKHSFGENPTCWKNTSALLMLQLIAATVAESNLPF